MGKETRNKMAAEMAEKIKACQNKSTNISIDDEIQNILVKNPEKVIDIDFVQELSGDKSVKSNHEMETDLQTLSADFADFKKYVLEVFANLIETNQSNDQEIQNTCIT